MQNKKSQQLKEKWIFRLNYAGFRIQIYLKRDTERAVEFYILTPNGSLSKEKIWIPKSTLRSGRDGQDIYGVDYIFEDYENREKLERLGYRL